MFEKNVKIVAAVNTKQGKKRLDYYLVLPGGVQEYLTTRNYNEKCYELCKSGIRYNELMKIRTRDKGAMNLVDYMRFIADDVKCEFEVA